MSAQRWLRRMVGLFPESYRATRSDELLDALDDATPTGRAAISEAFSLAKASMTAWRKYLATPAGIRRAAFFGAMCWLGVLISFGPVGRVQSADRGALYGFYEPDARMQSIVAACLLAVSFVAMFRYRWLSALTGVVGIVFAAISIRAGQWQLGAALPYEARWIGVPLIAAAVLRGSRRVRWPMLLAAIPGMMLAVGPYGKADRLPGYGFGLQSLNDPPETTPREVCSIDALGNVVGNCVRRIEPIIGHQWLDILIVVAGIIVVVGPWVFPASAAMLLPVAVHISLLARWPSVFAVTAYLAAALWIRVYWQPSLPTVTIRIKRNE